MFGMSEPPPLQAVPVQVPLTPRPEPPTYKRPNVTRGLSRYGPWGYLMLGMLLCGAALLVCGLWGN